MKNRKRERLLGDTPMTAGRFAGRPMRSVPRSHLLWLLNDAKADIATKWLVRQWLETHKEPA